jgi:hypothetical protein
MLRNALNPERRLGAEKNSLERRDQALKPHKELGAISVKKSPEETNNHAMPLTMYHFPGTNPRIIMITVTEDAGISTSIAEKGDGEF